MKSTSIVQLPNEIWFHIVKSFMSDIKNVIHLLQTSKAFYAFLKDENFLKILFPPNETHLIINTITRTVEKGCLKILRYLLERSGIQEKHFKTTPCQKKLVKNAIEKGQLDIFKYLINEMKFLEYEEVTRRFSDKKQEFVFWEAKNDYSELLHIAVENNQKDIVNHLIEEKKADPTKAFGNQPKTTSVILAAKKADLELFEYLIKAASSIKKIKDSEIENLLSWAVEKRNTAVIKYLLETYCDKLITHSLWRKTSTHCIKAHVIEILNGIKDQGTLTKLLGKLPIDKNTFSKDFLILVLKNNYTVIIKNFIALTKHNRLIHLFKEITHEKQTDSYIIGFLTLLLKGEIIFPEAVLEKLLLSSIKVSDRKEHIKFLIMCEDKKNNVLLNFMLKNLFSNLLSSNATILNSSDIIYAGKKEEKTPMEVALILASKYQKTLEECRQFYKWWKTAPNCFRYKKILSTLRPAIEYQNPSLVEVLLENELVFDLDLTLDPNPNPNPKESNPSDTCALKFLRNEVDACLTLAIEKNNQSQSKKTNPIINSLERKAEEINDKYRLEKRLLAYIENRKRQAELHSNSHNNYYKLFGKSINFGFSATKKIEAATYLLHCIRAGGDALTLSNETKHLPALNNGNLNEIYKAFKELQTRCCAERLRVLGYN